MSTPGAVSGASPLPRSQTKTPSNENALKRKRGNGSHSPEAPSPASGTASAGRLHRDVGAAAAALLEGHLAIDEGEEGVVAPHADIAAGMELGAALAHQDVARHHGLAAEVLDAEPASRGVAAVARAAACFLVSHRALLRHSIRIPLNSFSW